MKCKLKNWFYELLKVIIKIVNYYKKYIFIFSIIFLISFITGILTSAEYVKDLTCEDLINKYLYAFLAKDMSLISFYLTMCFYYCVFVFALTFLTKNKFMLIIFSAIGVLCAYIYGFDICIFLVTLGLSGIIIGFISLGILGLIIAFGLIILFAMVSYNIKDKTAIKLVCNKKDYYKLVFLIAFLSLIILFFLCFILGIIHIFVIV